MSSSAPIPIDTTDKSISIDAAAVGGVGRWHRMKVWWNGGEEANKRREAEKLLHTHRHKEQNKKQVKHHARTQNAASNNTYGSASSFSSSSSSPPGVTSATPRGSFSGQSPPARFHMSLHGSMNSTALKASLTPTRGTATSNVNVNGTMSTNGTLPPPNLSPSSTPSPPFTHQHQQQQRSTNSKRRSSEIPSFNEHMSPSSSSTITPILRPIPSHPSGMITISSASSPLSPSHHRLLHHRPDDDNPILISGSPWWRHTQRDVDAAMNAVKRNASPTPTSSSISVSTSASVPAVDERSKITSTSVAPPNQPNHTVLIKERDIFSQQSQSHAKLTRISHESNLTADGVGSHGEHDNTPESLDQDHSRHHKQQTQHTHQRQPSNGNSKQPHASVHHSHINIPYSHSHQHPSSSSSHSSVVPNPPPLIPPPPSRDSHEAVRKSHIAREMKLADDLYKRKLRKVGQVAATTASEHSYEHHHHVNNRAEHHQRPSSHGRAPSPVDSQSHSSTTALSCLHPDSPNSVALHALLQPSGSDRFWYSVVLASWPRMLSSTILIKMIERDGVPAALRHLVWTEMMTGGRRRRQRPGNDNDAATHTSRPPNRATIADSSSHSSHPSSSMLTDIRRMKNDVGRRMSETAPSPPTNGECRSLSSSMPKESSAHLSPATTAVATAITHSHMHSSPRCTIMPGLPDHLQPVERCTFCTTEVDPPPGGSQSNDNESDEHLPHPSLTCTCPLDASLFLPLLNPPSSRSLEMVLEGFVELQSREMSQEDSSASSSSSIANASDAGTGAGSGVQGYVQGQSYLADVLLRSMPPHLAIECMYELFQHKFFHAYTRMNVDEITKRFAMFEQTLALNAPHLAAHFQKCGLPADCYYLEFLATLGAKQLPSQWIARIWDGYMLHGEVFILKMTIGLLQLLQPILLQLDVSHLVRALREPTTLGVFATSPTPTPLGHSVGQSFESSSTTSTGADSSASVNSRASNIISTSHSLSTTDVMTTTVTTSRSFTIISKSNSNSNSTLSSVDNSPSQSTFITPLPQSRLTSSGPALSDHGPARIEADTNNITIASSSSSSPSTTNSSDPSPSTTTPSTTTTTTTTTSASTSAGLLSLPDSASFGVMNVSPPEELNIHQEYMSTVESTPSASQPHIIYTKDMTVDNKSNMASLKSSSSSSWWWPFSFSLTKSSQSTYSSESNSHSHSLTNSHSSHSSNRPTPPPHPHPHPHPPSQSIPSVFIHLQDLLIATQQVEVPTHVTQFCRK